MRRRAVLSLFFLAWPFVPLYGQDLVASLKELPLKESYRDEAPVSGRVIAGVTITGVVAAGLAVVPPASANGASICVHIMSRDGRYWSENTFELPTAVGGATPVVLDYPTKHREFLKQQKGNDLAVLGSAGECANTDLNTVFLSSTGSGTDEEASVNIFVNSSRADTFVAIGNVETKRRPARCQEIQEGRRTGFDTICKISLAKLDNSPEHLDIRILRRRYERMLPPTEFTLKLP